jgi:uncharacterized membrane protein affecting hemolysin expression
MINPLSLFFIALIIGIATLSPAQIRYAFDNPAASLNVFLNIGIVLAMVGLYIHYKRTTKSNTEEDYGLVGAKGGKAEKDKNDQEDSSQV